MAGINNVRRNLSPSPGLMLCVILLSELAYSGNKFSMRRLLFDLALELVRWSVTISRWPPWNYTERSGRLGIIQHNLGPTPSEMMSLLTKFYEYVSAFIFFSNIKRCRYVSVILGTGFLSLFKEYVRVGVIGPVLTYLQRQSVFHINRHHSLLVGIVNLF